jgi:tRNA pseudouridine38-40 synthase
LETALAARIAIGLSYDGAGYEGWQSQPSGNTVQDRLEAALSAVASTLVRVVAAGRTDTGVHAAAQVCHFETEAARPMSAWVRGTNAHLPAGIAVQWACEVDAGFHARFSAIGRSYVYVLYNHPVRPALFARQMGWFHRPLDVDAMRRAAGCLLGEHDFSAFRSSECQAAHPVRVMREVTIDKRGDCILFRFTANAFLHHMVRNLIGALVQIGKAAQPPEWLDELLAGRDRTVAAPTFSPAGLYLAQVDYPATWRLPTFAPMILPLSGD